jgi:ABC-2 type transport system permease protein
VTVPLAASILMPMRIAEVGVAPWQVGRSMAFTAVAIVVVVRFADRIYANSALQTGAQVPLLEALHG